MLQHIDNKALIPIHFREVIEKQIVVREPAVYIQHLRLKFPRTLQTLDAAHLPAWARSVLKTAKRVRAKAVKGIPFASLVSQYSSDYTKHKKGFLGWIVRSSMGDAYWKAVSRIPVGSVSSPIIMGNGIYLAKVTKKKVLHAGNYRKYLHGRFAFALQERLRKKAKKMYIERLFQRGGIRIRKKDLSGGKPQKLLVRIGDWKLTVQDFESRFKAFSKGYKINTFSTKKKLEWRWRFLKEYLIAPRLIIKDALRHRLDKTAAYKQALRRNKAVRDRVLFIEMKDYLFRTGVGEVSIAKIKKIYNKLKKTRYYSKRAISPQQVDNYPKDMVIREKGRIYLKVLKPFESVKSKATHFYNDGSAIQLV